MDPNSNNVPLVALAIEIGVSADELAAQLGDDVIIDDLTGLRVVSAELSGAYLGTVRAARQAQADRRAAATDEARRRPDAVRERVRALQAAQATPTGVPGEPLDPRQALAMMQQLDGSRDRQLADAATRRDELAVGKNVYRPFRNEE